MSVLVSLTPLLSVFAVVIGGVFSFVQWLDVRRRETKQRRWDQYQHTIVLAWGGGSKEEGVPTTLQIAAVYQLAEFKEFAFMTALSLKYVVIENPELITPKWKQFIGPHVERVIKVLQQTRAYKYQAKQFANQ
jgi:hypothetical protein